MARKSTDPALSTLAAEPKQRTPAVLVPGRVQPSAITIAVLGAVLTAVQLVNWLSSGWLTNHAGIRPRSIDGLLGILTAPLVHASWEHLVTNLVPFLILGFLLLIAGGRQFTAVTILIWLLAGAGVWLTGSAGPVVVGASALVFGWLTFLVVRGVFTRRFTQIVLGLVLLALWGGMLWGVIPGKADISWQGHLFGALSGVLAAFLVARADADQQRDRAPSPSV